MKKLLLLLLLVGCKAPQFTESTTVTSDTTKTQKVDTIYLASSLDSAESILHVICDSNILIIDTIKYKQGYKTKVKTNVNNGYIVTKAICMEDSLVKILITQKETIKIDTEKIITNQKQIEKLTGQIENYRAAIVILVLIIAFALYVNRK